ncbi:unnamed protein product, partial [Larinioides sclopetarius]
YSSISSSFPCSEDFRGNLPHNFTYWSPYHVFLNIWKAVLGPNGWKK